MSLILRPAWRLHLHFQSGEHLSCALLHLQLEQSSLHEYFISSRHALDSSETVNQTGTLALPTLVQANSAGEWMSC